MTISHGIVRDAHRLPTVDPVIESEQALLGILLSNSDAWGEVADLGPEDFYEPTGLHGLLFEAMRSEVDAGREVSQTAMHTRFSPLADQVEAPHYVLDLWDKAPPPSQTAVLAAQVSAAASQRRLAREVSRPGLTVAELSTIVQDEARRLDASSRRQPIRATPFVWSEPSSFPRRSWLYGRHYIRRFVSCSIAPGAVGKTSHGVVEALAMVADRALLNVRPVDRLKVWLWNGEDPREECERKVLAACKHYGLSGHDLAGGLYVDSGRQTPIILARATRTGLQIAVPSARQIEREIRERGIDVLVVDPFVSCHEVSENDNGAINAVVTLWKDIADRTGCAIELIHHARKGDTHRTEITPDDARGAGALLAAVRSGRVFNVMSEAEAMQWGIEARRGYFRVDDGKANLAPPSAFAKWRQLVSVDLENGEPGFSDLVGVVTAWEPPNHAAGLTPEITLAVQQAVGAGAWKASIQSPRWAGVAVATVMGLDLDRPADKARVKMLIKEWLKTGALREEDRFDEDQRKDKPHVVVGEWVAE